jgi:hypothetical protein
MLGNFGCRHATAGIGLKRTQLAPGRAVALWVEPLCVSPLFWASQSQARRAGTRVATKTRPDALSSAIGKLRLASWIGQEATTLASRPAAALPPLLIWQPVKPPEGPDGPSSGKRLPRGAPEGAETGTARQPLVCPCSRWRPRFRAHTGRLATLATHRAMSIAAKSGERRATNQRAGRRCRLPAPRSWRRTLL